MEDERSEDLNPRSEDIEDKVKRMMDPTIPDEPKESAIPIKAIPTSKKTGKVQAISTPADATGDSLPSAPELPAAAKKITKKSPPVSASKKVIIPISHDSDASEPADDAKPAEENAVIPEPDPEPVATAIIPPAKKITIDEAGESPDDIAHKLDEAIAGLESGPPASNQPDQAETTGKIEQESIGPEEELPINDPEIITDPETDKAVQDIVAHESDELLEVEDAIRDTDEPLKPVKKPRRSLRQTIKDLWSKPGVRKGLIVFLILSILIVLAVPTSRYFVLNSVGVRASSSLLILDDSTKQPLKNVKVSIGDRSEVTDAEGKVKLRKVKLGATALSIEKRAFAPITKRVTMGWGSNPLGDFKLVPTGTQYSFTVTDFLTGKPVAKVQAESNDANAISDDNGVIKLTIDRPNDNKLAVSIKGSGYRTEELSIDPDDKSDHPVRLVPARKQVFVSNRSGKYDIYSVYIDGKDEKLVLAGSGSERDDMVIVPHSSAEVVAYVSTRGNQHNSEGYLLSNLILINPEDNDTTNIIAAERIQVVSFSGDHLVYVQVAAGSSASNPQRYRLMSYNYKEDTNKEIAASNYFNDVLAAGGAIYYAPSSAYQTGKTSFYKANPDGSNPEAIFGEEVWNIFRTAYDHLTLSVQQQWYDYRLGDKAPTKLNSAPANQISRVYIDSPDGKRSIWVDNRDGKGTLLLYDIGSKVDKTLRSQSGLSYPLRWLNNSVITYRIKTAQETADYALSLDGGEPVKIRDVTNSAGLSR